MKATCSDRKSNASLKSSMTPGQLPEGTTSPQIVMPAGQVDGLDAAFKKMFPAQETDKANGPAGGGRGTVKA